MVYRFLADLTIVAHFIWILFIIFGFVFALFKSKIALLHFAGLIFVLIMNLMGWYCPLTYLESHLYSLNNIRSTYTGSFIIRYLGPLIYPDMPEQYIRIGEISFACIYIIFYVYIAKKHHILR